jgi:hypothetical protein
MDKLLMKKGMTKVDLKKLQEIAAVAQQKSNTFQDNVEIDLNEDRIQDTYRNAFASLTKRSRDTPHIACISCEKLCFFKEVRQIAKLKYL